jgi:hypothetical protein
MHTAAELSLQAAMLGRHRHKSLFVVSYFLNEWSAAAGVPHKKKSHFLSCAQPTFHENNIHAPYCLYSGCEREKDLCTREKERAVLCVQCRLHTISKPFLRIKGIKI